MSDISCVLIVDDSDSDQFLAKLSIEDHDPDIEIYQAFDGMEALELLAESGLKPDLIFLDINMPRMNGHEFLEAYEAAGNPASSVIVMLTSSSLKGDREQVERYDFVKNYIVKPLQDTIVKELA